MRVRERIQGKEPRRYGIWKEAERQFMVGNSRFIQKTGWSEH